MGDLIGRLMVEGPQAWRQLSLVQKGTLVGVALSALAAIMFLTQWAQQPDYAVAFSGLSEGDASAIVTRLKEMKIPYELGEGGTLVRVPAEQVYDVRLQLASQGLPKGGSVGFELFDKMSFGLTDFAQKLNFQRGLEGELARTIGRLDGVEGARVHIVIPHNELFVEKEKPATASVVLNLRNGVVMDARQVRGIASLVARSVEGLKPENITVLNGEGVTLSGQDDSLGMIGQSSSQQDTQRAYERNLQQNIQAMLEQVLGARKAVVRVSATLDWDRYESNSETYSPAGRPTQVRSAKEVVERSATALGTDGSYNVPTYPLGSRSPAGPASASAAAFATPAATPDAEATPGATGVTTVATSTGEPGYERRETTTNYEISKQVERTVRTPGAIKRLSVSVLLDGQLDDALVSSISKAVTAAAGLDQARGDSVVVASLPFDQTSTVAQTQATEESAKRELYASVAKGGLVVVSLLVVLLLVRSMIKGLTRQEEGARETKGLVKQEALPAMPIRIQREEDPRPALIQREVTEMARIEPKLVAQIVKSWLDEK